MPIIKKFGYIRCEKVLPLVFDDSLSYMELLYKVLGKLNDVIDVVNIHEQRLDTIEDFLDGIEEMIRQRDEDIHNLQEDVADIYNQITNITTGYEGVEQDLSWLETNVRNNIEEIARLKSRVSVLEGYAFEGITPATPEEIAGMETRIYNYIDEQVGILQGEIDAIMGGGWTPTYGSVDFGTGVLLRHDETITDPSNPDQMVVASRDFQVSAAYVRALNMVYGCFYISMSEGAEVVAMPGDTFVLCWQNSSDLPPIADNFPGVKVKWDANHDHIPDLFKMGIDYNNTFEKRVDCYYGKRNQYPEVLGNGYKWYCPVYLDHIQTGSPVTNWAIIQIPFCYLTLDNSSLWLYETEDVTFTGNPSQVIDTGVAPFSSLNMGKSWEMDYSVSLSPDNNIPRTMLACVNSSAKRNVNNIYWTGGSSNTDLTHSQLMVRDPGFGIGGQAFAGAGAQSFCIRGTNFRIRSNTLIPLLKDSSDNCAENRINIKCDFVNNVITCEITYVYSDTTTETISRTASLKNGNDVMVFTESNESLLLGGSYDNTYTEGVYDFVAGSQASPVVMNYFKFRFYEPEPQP